MRTLRIILSLRAPSGKKLGSAFVLVLFLFLQALSVSTALHHLFHADAGHPEHQCAATLLAQGQIDVAETAVPYSLSVARFEFVQLPRLLVLEAADYLLLPGRAPPSFS